MTAYLFPLVSVVILATNVFAQKPTEANCDKNKMDTCTQRLTMISDPNFVFPVNMDQMNKRCKEIKPLERCVKDYSQKCLSSTTRQSISVLTFSIARTNKNYCVNNKRKNSFIAFGQCLNQNFKTLYRYINDMNHSFHGARIYKEKKLRVPMACCNYYKFKERVVQLINEKCPEHTTEVERLVDGYAHDILNLLCGDYTEESDKCQSVTPKTPKWTKPLDWKTFINPLVEILDSLD